MKCERVSDLISSYLDGCLPANKAEAVRIHIGGCDRCRAEMAAEQVATRALGSPVKSFDAPDVLAQVKSRVVRRQTARPRWQWAFAGVAAACCLIWLALSLVPRSPSPQQAATKHATGPVATAPEAPAVKAEPEVVSSAAEKPAAEKPRIVRHKSPKPLRRVARPTPAHRPVAPEPKMEYLVVYKQPGLGDGLSFAVSDATDAPEPENPATSSYTIRMTDESTGTVTGVSAYSNSDGETEESATVRFQSETPDAVEPERSSTDETPLHITGGPARSDLC